MKILAFTDLHEDQRALARIKAAIAAEGVDIAVCAGDFTIFGHNTKRVLKSLDSLGVPLVLIHGNHEDEEEVAAALEGCENIHWVHLQAADVGGIRFIGYGGGGFRRREPELEEFEESIAGEFNERTIFLCHAPPYGTALDEAAPGWHVGNESLTRLIRRRRPMVVFSGHIHECFHAHDTLAGATLINPGPDGEIIEIEDE